MAGDGRERRQPRRSDVIGLLRVVSEVMDVAVDSAEDFLAPDDLVRTTNASFRAGTRHNGK